VPGRHDSHVGGRDGWAPTAVNAVAACTPATSLLAALGLAGGGYLTGREDVAACGALVGAFGLVAERLHSRGLRRRLRRERMRHRDDLREVSRELADLQRQFAALRTDLQSARADRDELAGVEAVSARRLQLPAPLVPEPAVPEPAVPMSVASVPVVPEPVLAEPVVPVAVAPAPAAALGLLIPGQQRSPIATGGIPLLAPGPSEPVRVIDLRVTQPIPLSALRPAGAPEPTLPAATVDALVYAALAEAEADELTRVLTDPGRPGRHAGLLHAGDAHHAGDYARVDDAPAAPTLFVVNRGRHVA